MITFNQISAHRRTPGVVIEIDSSSATSAALRKPYRALLIGQKRTSGTAPFLTPNVVTSAKQAETLYGQRSQLAAMVAAFLAVNPGGELRVVAVADPVSATGATGTLTLTVSSPQAGTLAIYIGGRRYAIVVSTVTTQDGLATAVAAAINADTGAFVTASSVSNVVTFTATQVGAIGNLIDLRKNYADGDATPVGVTAVFASMSGGAGDVDLSVLWPVLGDVQYDVIGAGLADVTNLIGLENELADRWGAEREIEGLGIIATNVSQETAQAFGSLRNSPHVSIVSSRGYPDPSYTIAAAVAGVVAREGQNDPARPFQTLPLTGKLPSQPADRQTQAERNALLGDGISTLLVGPGGVVEIERLITTRQLNEAGAEDLAYFDVTTPLTLGTLRWSLRNRIRTKYPRHKVADDGTNFDPGQAIVTPSILKAEIVAWYAEQEAGGLVEDRDAFNASLIVERSTMDPTRLEARLSPNLVNPLTIIAGQILFVL